MKRFYRDAVAAAVDGGWQVQLDGRGVKTALGQPQIVTSKPLVDALAAEWAGQGEEIDPAGFMLRDLADYAIDVVRADREAAIAGLLRYAETDTLCYRADPGDPLYQRQQELWEPLLAAAEGRWDIHFRRISGVLHQPQPPETLHRLNGVLAASDDFTLAALVTLAALAASLVTALAALDADAQSVDAQSVDALWTAASLEEEWQADLWGRDAEAEGRRAGRRASFVAAQRFARLAAPA